MKLHVIDDTCVYFPAVVIQDVIVTMGLF